MSGIPRLLVVRDDRLGDTLLSLPALELLRLVFPDHGIDLHCRAEVGEAIAPYLRDRDIGLWPVGRAAGAPAKYGAALYLHASASTIMQGWRERIAVRVGLRSKLPSLLLLTDAVAQRRSLAERSEGEYNVELARVLAVRLGAALPAGPVPLIEIASGEEEALEAGRRLSELGLSEGGFLIVHPGMGGSALNVSAAGYLEIVDKLSAKYGKPVLLTQGPLAEDRALVSAIRAARPSVQVLSDIRLPCLREVFRRAALVVAPSTGPLHLAHYVGATTLGLYSPVRSHHPRRWAPWGGTGASRVLVPEVGCPAKSDCLKERCREYPCMDRAPWGKWVGEVG